MNLLDSRSRTDTRRYGSAAAAKGGFALGSLGAFLVIEARDHAEKRGAKPLGRLRAWSPTAPTESLARLRRRCRRLWDRLKGKIKIGHAAVLSGATGAHPATAEERQFLELHPTLPFAPPAHISAMGWSRNFP